MIREEKTMKRLAIAFILVLMAIFVSVSMAACKKNTVRYNLVDMRLANITVSHYEYNYIEFNNDDSTYELKNKTKSNGIVTTQKGHFLVDVDNYVTITNDDIPSQNYLLCQNETIQFINDTLTIEGRIAGSRVYMIFKK